MLRRQVLSGSGSPDRPDAIPDCALGKKYAALAISRAFLKRDGASDFRATKPAS